MKNYKIIWTNSAKAQLKALYQYYRNEKGTIQGAENVKNDILAAVKNIVFESQYQKDEIQPEYRRIVVRNYKILYTEEEGTIVVLKIFSTLQHPNKQ